ncbi:MAG: hypothetical protein HY892_09710 [Deltaproteobacteria bacterium]|nr:hypothetical protein [Deltaproteobacteria bacterium]
MIKRRAALRRGIMVWWALLFYGLIPETADLWAYTYNYHNRTGQTLRLTVELYDDGARTLPLGTEATQTMVSPFLLKSWSAEALLDGRWQQVLHLTCDFLPGDHAFSIYVQEDRNDRGESTRVWNVRSGNE